MHEVYDSRNTFNAFPVLCMTLGISLGQPTAVFHLAGSTKEVDRPLNLYGCCQKSCSF